MNYLLEILPSLMSGLKMTLGVFFITIIGSVPLGIIVSLGMKSQYFTIRWLINGYIWIMRGTPLLLQLIFVYYGLGIMGITFPRFEAAVIAFVINYAAYLAEIFRGGLQAIPRGQYDAAKVLGLTRTQTFFKIVLPQVIKIVVPSFGNEVINLVKDTSLVYVIGLGDMLRAGNIAASRDVTLVPYLLVGLIYLMMTAIVTVMLRRSENRLNRWK